MNSTTKMIPSSVIHDSTGGQKSLFTISRHVLVSLLPSHPLHLLFLQVLHHAVDAVFGGHVGSMNQTVGGGVEVIATGRQSDRFHVTKNKL